MQEKLTLSFPKAKVRMVAAAVLLLVLAPFVATALDLYAIGSQNQVLMKIARALPYPAVSIDGNRFTYKEYENEITNLERILKGQGAPTNRSEMQKMFLDRLKRAAAVKRLTSERALDLDSAVKLARSLTFGDKMTNEEIAEAVSTQFSWSMGYFESQVLMPYAREMAFALDILKPKALEIAAAVKAPGADFAKIAKDFGEDATKENGGDLGWFKRGAMVPEFENQVFNMKKDEISGPFASRFGWHVVKVTDIRGEGEAMEVRASHIIVTLKSHEADIEPLIAQAQNDVKVTILVKE